MLLHEDLTREIISIFYTVYNELGYGFLERVYENAMLIELRNREISCKEQSIILVKYRGSVVGNYVADILVDDRVIIEIKAAEDLCEAHEAQLINYLRATDIEVGLLLNFGKRPQFKRKFFTNDLKADY